MAVRRIRGREIGILPSAGAVLAGYCCPRRRCRWGGPPQPPPFPCRPPTWANASTTKSDPVEIAVCHRICPACLSRSDYAGIDRLSASALSMKKIQRHCPLGVTDAAHRVSQSGRRLIVSTSFKISMSVYFHPALTATDFSRLKRSGFTRNIISRVSTVLFTLPLPTSRFPIFRFPNLSFPTTQFLLRKLII